MTLIPNLCLKSDQLPAGLAFETWKAAMPFYQVFLGPEVSEETFRCRAQSWFLGDMILTRTSVSAVRFVRSSEQILTDGVDSYSLVAFTEGCWSGDIHGESLSVGAGQIVGLDLSKPLDVTATDCNALFLGVSRTAIRDRLRVDPNLHGHVFKGVGAEMLLDHLASLERHVPAMVTDDVPAIVNATLGMITAALSVIPRENETKPSLLSFQHNVRRFIDRHLSDSDLTPDYIAEKMSIARSTLFRCFEPLGGVAAYIQRRRLEAVRALLIHPGENRSIGEVAHTFGFVSSSHFAVAFKKAYGRSAREVREAASGARVSAGISGESALPQAFRDWMRELQLR